MKTIYSIGLNVGDTEFASQLSATLALAAQRFRIHSMAMGASEWEGVPERFLQFSVEQPADTIAAGQLALALRQSAVAVLPEYAERWILAGADGLILVGGSVADFPVIV